MSMPIPRENRKKNSQGTYEFLDGCMTIHIIFIAELHVSNKEPIRKKESEAKLTTSNGTPESVW
jgi:hypothetical protein